MAIDFWGYPFQWFFRGNEIVLELPYIAWHSCWDLYSTGECVYMTISGNPQDQLWKVSSEMCSLSSLWGRYPTNNPFLFGIVWIRLPKCCLVAFFQQTNNQVGRPDIFVLFVLPRWCLLVNDQFQRVFFGDVALSPGMKLGVFFFKAKFPRSCIRVYRLWKYTRPNSICKFWKHSRIAVDGSKLQITNTLPKFNSLPPEKLQNLN